MLFAFALTRFRRPLHRPAFGTLGNAAPTTNRHPGVTSKRQQFKAIAPDKRVLDYLDSNQLGFCAKRRVRVALARKYAPTSTRPATTSSAATKPPPAPRRTRGLLDQTFLSDRFHESPYPFHRPGRALAVARDVADLLPTAAPAAALVHAPEVALVGRSNVGKSTLLNALLGLEAARAADSRAAVSDKPGETQSLHFYGVGRMDVGPPGAEHTAPALVITDMPGFGFAYLNEHDAARCRRLTRAYLLAPPPGTGAEVAAVVATRPGLKRVLLLVDARHGLKAGDVAFLEDLFGRKDLDSGGRIGHGSINDGGSEAATTPPVRVRWQLQVVLTKSDLVERSDLARRLALVDDRLRAVLAATRRPPGLGQVLPAVAVAAADYKGLLHLKKDLSKLLPPRPTTPVTRPPDDVAVTATAAKTKQPALRQWPRPTGQPPSKINRTGAAGKEGEGKQPRREASHSPDTNGRSVKTRRRWLRTPKDGENK